MNERDYRELNVLGDIATDKKAFNQVKDELNPELFTGINKQIYQIIADLHVGGKCEYNTIVDKAIEMGIAKDDWGNPGLMRINAMINGAAECPFVEIQKDLAKLKDNPLNEFFGNDPSISLFGPCRQIACLKITVN